MMRTLMVMRVLIFLFRDALEDIDNSIEAGYPSHLLYKLLDRKLRCCKELKMAQTNILDHIEQVNC